MSPVTYDEALAAIAARLTEKAAKHCKRVSDSATVLALAYGVDPELARLAGVLHDWDRQRAPEELLAVARDAGIEITRADEVTPHLLHARTGAVGAAAALPGLPPEVVEAISRHTVGAPEMTPLDMVVYLADMIESHRDFDGVEALRDAVGTVTLPELFALGYQQSVRHLVDSRRMMHPTTVEVWNALVAGEKR